MNKNGWYAENENRLPGRWRPVLQLDGHVQEFEIFFDTNDACEDWIRSEVLGAGMLDVPGAAPEPDDETIRAYLDRHPEVLRAFLEKEARIRAPWFREFANREERIRGHRNPSNILRGDVPGYLR